MEALRRIRRCVRTWCKVIVVSLLANLIFLSKSNDITACADPPSIDSSRCGPGRTPHTICTPQPTPRATCQTPTSTARHTPHITHTCTPRTPNIAHDHTQLAPHTAGPPTTLYTTTHHIAQRSITVHKARPHTTVPHRTAPHHTTLHQASRHHTYTHTHRTVPHRAAPNRIIYTTIHARQVRPGAYPATQRARGLARGRSGPRYRPPIPRSPLVDRRQPACRSSWPGD